MPCKPRLSGRVKGHNQNEISFPGRAALCLPAVGRGRELHNWKKKPRSLKTRIDLQNTLSSVILSTQAVCACTPKCLPSPKRFVQVDVTARRRGNPTKSLRGLSPWQSDTKGHSDPVFNTGEESHWSAQGKLREESDRDPSGVALRMTALQSVPSLCSGQGFISFAMSVSSVYS